MRETEVLVGRCGVDSGQVWIGDPCYVMEDMFGGGDEPPTGGMYDECCRVTLSKDAAGEAALGVASSTNYGDGSYPVYVTYDGSGRPVSLRIDFVQEEEEEEDEPRCDWCHVIFGEECFLCNNCECNCECKDEEEEVCTSDDPNDHQGDTCPVHEGEDTQ